MAAHGLHTRLLRMWLLRLRGVDTPIASFLGEVEKMIVEDEEGRAIGGVLAGKTLNPAQVDAVGFAPEERGLGAEPNAKRLSALDLGQDPRGQGSRRKGILRHLPLQEKRDAHVEAAAQHLVAEAALQGERVSRLKIGLLRAHRAPRLRRVEVVERKRREVEGVLLVEPGGSPRGKFVAPLSQAGIVVGTGSVATGRKVEPETGDCVDVGSMPAKLEGLEVHVSEPVARRGYVEPRIIY